jgi:hypothetical protein
MLMKTRFRRWLEVICALFLDVVGEWSWSTSGKVLTRLSF